MIEAAWAKDAEGNDVNTYYELEGNNLVQVVDFDENSLFPIVADPEVGATKSFSFKISNTALGIPGVAGKPLTVAVKKILTNKIKEKVAAKVGSKLIPGLSWASYVAGALAFINSLTGKDGFKISGTLIYRKKVLQREGYTIKGWDVKTLKITRY